MRKRRPQPEKKILGEIELIIEGVAFGGKGLAKKDGKVYFVKGAVPGDHIICQLEKDKKSFGEGYASKFLKKSDSWEKAGCENYGECGGCQWLGVDYSQQLSWKKSFIESSLRKAKCELKNEIEMIGSPEERNYRSRIMVRVHVGQNGKATFGFFKMRSRELVALKSCELASEKINLLLQELSNFKSTEMASSKFRMEIQEIPAASTNDSSLFVTVTPAEGRHQNLQPIIEYVNNSKLVNWCGSFKDVKTSKPVLFERDLETDFYVSPGQFFQVNLEHNKILRRLVKEKVDALNPDSIYDVYCGSGNLSLFLQNGKRKIYGVEVNPVSIGNANKSVDSCKNLQSSKSLFRYETLDAVKHVNMMREEGNKFDLIILDPPREGMPEGIESLVSLGAKDIIYVSCDPVTLSRDLQKLTSFNYEIVDFKGLDFFPQTYHVESFVHLKKK